MQITLKEIDRYYMPRHYRTKFQQLFPNGATTTELLTNSQVPLDILHWVKKYIQLTPEENQLYLKRCEINGHCSSVWYSSKVENSQAVYYCTQVKSSMDVRDSENVVKSQHIGSSSVIENSQYISTSHNISNSFHIQDSQNLNNCEFCVLTTDSKFSKMIYKSTTIAWSQNIHLCSEIEDSQYIYDAHKARDAYFCGRCYNIKHCLFCSDLSNTEYQIFNTPVSPSEFEFWKQQLLEMLLAEQPTMIRYKDDALDGYLEINDMLNNVFDGLSQLFYKWLKSVPYYTEEKMLSVFLTPPLEI